MRPTLRMIACLLLLLVNVAVLLAQWESTGATPGAYGFKAIGAAGKYMTVTGRYDLMRPICSKDGGESWFVSSGLGTSIYSPILVTSGADTSVLAVGYGYSVYCLRDTAQAWVRSDSGLGGAQVRGLANVPGAGSAAGGVVVASAPGAGIYVSTDLGAHWMPSDSGLTTLSTVTVTAVDSTFLVGTTNQGVFRSIDKGFSWSPANSGLADTSINTLVSAWGWAFATSGTNVYQSSDRGESWSLIPKTVPAAAQNLVLVPTPGKGIGVAIFAVTSSGRYRLSPDDSDWVQVKGPPFQMISEDIPSTLTAVDTVLYTVDYDQMTCSTDLGKTWRFISDGSVGTPTREYTTGHKSSRYDHARLYLGPYVSTNFGSRWVSTHPLYTDGSHITGFSVSSDTSAQGFDRLVVGTDSGAVEYSSDGGETWKVLRQRPEHPRFFGASRVPAVAELDGIVFASLQGIDLYHHLPGDTVAGVYRTNVDGTTWEKMNTPGLTDSLVLSLDLFHGKDGGRILFAGTWYNLFRSTNDGESWTAADTSGGRIHSGRKRLRQVNGTLFLGIEGTGVVQYDEDGNETRTYDSAGVYKSTNDGLTWNRVTGNLGATFVRGFAAVAIPEYPDRVLLAACRDAYLEQYTGDVLTSTEGGKQWKSFGAGLSVPTLSVPVGADDRFVYCMGRRRPWSEADLTAVKPVEASCPVRFSLSQNYPNPFNPKTAIRYQVSGVSDVKLVVYDLLGREVAVLVNEKKAAGNYEVSFDGARLASGVYFYRLTAGSFVQSRKMILLK
jgi:photosystem II stability/assembly factor-like uncharacterized protein